MPTINLTANGRDQELILDYLTENASDVLAEKINNGTPFEKDGNRLVNKKDLNGFMSFACDEAKKLAEKGSRSACVEDSVVYGWATHYFEEDSIQGKLFNPDGTEYKPPAPVKKTTVKPTPTPPPKPKSQFSFFDMLNEKKAESTEQAAANETVTVTEQTNAVELRPDDHEPIDNAVQQTNEVPAVKQEQVTAPPTTPRSQHPLYEKYLTYVNRHPDSVIAMRVGDFYEIWGKTAVALADELNMTLTSRDLGLAQRMPVIGIRYLSSEMYFKKLRKSHTVIVVENEGERKLEEFGIEDVIDGDDELTEEEMRLFDGDIQEPKDIIERPTATSEPTPDSDSPYDEAALAKVVKLLGNDFILR